MGHTLVSVLFPPAGVVYYGLNGSDTLSTEPSVHLACIRFVAYHNEITRFEWVANWRYTWHLLAMRGYPALRAAMQAFRDFGQRMLIAAPLAIIGEEPSYNRDMDDVGLWLQTAPDPPGLVAEEDPPFVEEAEWEDFGHVPVDEDDDVDLSLPPPPLEGDTGPDTMEDVE